MKWAIKDGRLNLHNRPVECRAIGIPGSLARRAEEGAWAEAFPEAAKPGEAALEWTLDQAARKRRAFWEEALGCFKAAGFNLARTDARAPEALLEAADRIGMMVEQRIEPRLNYAQARERGGLAAAYAAAEAVRRDQAHPSLAFWRVETRDSSARLSALAGAMRTLDPTRPVFGFLSSDQRLRRPGIVHIPGIAEAKAALETACLDPGQPRSLLWRLYSNSIDPEHPLPVKPVWFWAPVAGEIGALKPAELADRLLFARANPLSAGCGAALAPPNWASDSAPLPTRMPKMRDFLAGFDDAETSAALAESLNAAQLIPDPSTQMIPLGRSTRLDLAWVFGRDQAPPAKAVLQFSIYHEKPGKSNGAASSSGPPGSSDSAKSTSSISSTSPTPSIPSASPSDPPALATVERTVAPAQMSGGKHVCRFGVELEFSRDLPPGPAWLVVQARWDNKVLASKPLEITLAGR